MSVASDDSLLSTCSIDNNTFTLNNVLTTTPSRKGGYSKKHTDASYAPFTLGDSEDWKVENFSVVLYVCIIRVV